MRILGWSGFRTWERRSPDANPEWSANVNISISDGFLEATIRLHPADTRRVAAFLDKMLHAPDAAGLHPELIHDAQDRAMRSFKVTHDLRAIGRIAGDETHMLYVAQHDEAYRWAKEHCVDCRATESELHFIAGPARVVCDAAGLCETLDSAGVEHDLVR
jgi:hypothetical protein